MNRTRSPLLVALLLAIAAAALAASPVLAEEAVAPAAGAAAGEHGTPAGSIAGTPAAGEIFLAETPCGPVTCGGGQICCDATCGVCGRAGKPCPDQPLCLSTPIEEPAPPTPDDREEPLFLGVPCNERFCGPKEFCCNFSCSICASIFGGACTQQVCT